jgi:drug/metabolite transporter (DMT)-like permease
MVFARFINKEHISRRVMLAMGLVVAGAVLMVSFGNHESPIVTAHELLDLYSK